MKRLLAGWFLVLSAVVLGATPAWSAEGAAQRVSSRSVTDSAGDVVDSDGAKLKDARGDILQATADYKADSIQFEVRIAQFTDPVKDPNWTSDSTYLLWMLDTDGDAEGDFTIEYGIQNGRLYSAAFRLGAPDNATALCDAASVQTDPSGFYRLRLDPGCIGRPDSFGWSVEASYDTNARSDDAPATEDLLPNEGFTAPMYAPAGSQPSATGTASSPARPTGGSTTALSGDQPDGSPATAAGEAASSAATGAAVSAGGASGTNGQGTGSGDTASSASASAAANAGPSGGAAQSTSEAAGQSSAAAKARPTTTSPPPRRTNPGRAS